MLRATASTTTSRRSFLRCAALGAGIAAAGIGPWPLLGRHAARAADATPVASASALEDLRRRLNGTLMLPGDSGFLPASAPANGRFLDVRPVAVARCADEADVVTCVRWCNENGVAPTVRGGGHSYAGYSTTTGLLVDARRLNHVHIDKRAATAVTGGAARNGDYFVALEDGPLFLPGGTCLGVGVGGLVLGGGIGYNTHWAGLTADHLTATRVVTASGDVLDVDAANHPDLFWACRGGAGGSFGINTAFSFAMVEAPTGSVGWYRFAWRGADAATAVFAAFDEILRTAPAAFNAVAMAQASEVGTGGPREAIDVMSRGQYIGPLDELRDLVAPLLAAAPPTTQTLEERTFWGIQRDIATDEPEPHSYGDMSRYANAPLPAAAIARMVDLLAECPSRSDEANGSIWSLGWVGGPVINGVPRDATAYVHRDAMTLWRPTTVWPNDADPSVSSGLNAWTEAMIAVLDPHTPAESYQNFPNRNLPNALEQYYGENLERLIDVKTAYDPGNLFRNAQSIPPRSGG